MRACINPSARHCTCKVCDEDHESVNRFIYTNTDNSLARWMASDKWCEIPTRQNIRGECVEKLLTGSGRVTRFVVQGQVSGEFQCK